MSAEKVTIIDAKDLILGRMASMVSKRLLQGERIAIVNAEKAAISGKRFSIVKEAKNFLEVGHPRKGPYHFRSPDKILRKTIRGMLPRKRPKGKKTYKRLRVFTGIPEEFKDKEIQTLPEINASKLRCPYIYLEKVAKEIGWIPLSE